MAAPPGRSAQQRHLITKQASGSAKIDPLMAAFKRHCPHVDEPLVSSSAVICDLGSKPLIEGLAPHRCPFLTLKRTWSAFLGMSEKGQYPTSAGSSDDRGPNPMGGCIVDYLPYRGATICYCLNIGNGASAWELLGGDGTSSRFSAAPVTTHLITLDMAERAQRSSNELFDRARTAERIIRRRGLERPASTTKVCSPVPS